jgi:23S rRNA (uridine2552-2'-O)-methyltransferase
LSREWLRKRKKDPFYKQAKVEGYNSRAAYKLMELNERLSLFSAGSKVLDLGAAPGGWSQFALEVVGQRGLVVAVDLVPFSGVKGVEFVQGDIEAASTIEEILRFSNEFDCVLSDAAPHLSGNRNLDLGRALALNWAVLKISVVLLRKGGSTVVKMFRGDELIELKEGFSDRFRRVEEIKPRSSVTKSNEIYVAFRGFLGWQED